MTQMDSNLIAQSKSSLAGEIPFDVSEVAYSRTDERGVIAAANAVFVRLSGFEPDEIVGAPQKTVRHADIPRGVFALMWSRIKAGQCFGGYIKNRSKDGRYYWVFALVRPIDGGFSSVLIKPLTDTLATIEKIYARLLRAEADGTSPEVSATRLVEALRAAGYPDYEAFQAMALGREFASRTQALGQEADSGQTRFLTVGNAILDVQKEMADMLESFTAIRTVPLNMRILASRLENAGGPIGAISVNYGSMLDEMKDWVTDFSAPQRGALPRIRKAIFDAMLLTFMSRLQTDAAAILQAGDRAAEENAMSAETEARNIVDGAKLLQAEARGSLRETEREIERLGRSVLDMKRYVTGLSSTRMMCKIESATLTDSGNSLSGIVEQLDACQTEIEGRLARISELNSLIHSNTSMLRSASLEIPN